MLGFGGFAEIAPGGEYGEQNVRISIRRLRVSGVCGADLFAVSLKLHQVGDPVWRAKCKEFHW